MLAAIVYFLQPLGGVFWQITDPLAIAVIYALFASGWAILFLASFQINHGELFGLRQVWLYYIGKPYIAELQNTMVVLLSALPLYVGLMTGLWAAPTMTAAHLVFAILCTSYIFIGVRLDERDLENILPEYKQYKKTCLFFSECGY